VLGATSEYATEQSSKPRSPREDAQAYAIQERAESRTRLTGAIRRVDMGDDASNDDADALGQQSFVGRRDCASAWCREQLPAGVSEVLPCNRRVRGLVLRKEGNPFITLEELEALEWRSSTGRLENAA